MLSSRDRDIRSLISDAISVCGMSKRTVDVSDISGVLKTHSRVGSAVEMKLGSDSRRHHCYSPPGDWSYVSANTVSVSHLLNDSLSMNCLNSSVSSFSTAVITRARALSCSMRAFCL